MKEMCREEMKREILSPREMQKSARDVSLLRQRSHVNAQEIKCSLEAKLKAPLSCGRPDPNLKHDLFCICAAPGAYLAKLLSHL